MTTIAVTRTHMAADSRAVGAWIDPAHDKKIVKAGGDVIGMAGDTAQCNLFLKWYKDQTQPKPQARDMEDFEALLYKDGELWEYTELLEPVKVGFPCAIGSGAEFAMGAMFAGATARRAVQIGMELDPYTGGKVQIVRLRHVAKKTRKCLK